MTTISTVGHGTLVEDAFVALLTGDGIDLVADARAFPGSRRNPQFSRATLERSLPEAGIAYVWIPALGGRRRGVAGSRHVALRNEAFRAYADYMDTAAFAAGVDELLGLTVTGRSAAMMCSESVWWRCHRRLVADHLVLLRGVRVLHLMHDGRVAEHVPTTEVRLDGHRLVYDLGVTPPLPG